MSSTKRTNLPECHPPDDGKPFWRAGDGPDKYTARVWCVKHGRVEPEGSELCPECNSILHARGSYRASFRHGHRWMNRSRDTGIERGE